VIVGGKGPTRTPRLAARFAAEFNVPFSTLSETATQFERVRAVTDRPLVLSMAQTVACGRTDAELKRRTDAIGPAAARALTGTPDALVEQLGRFGEAGATRAFLQILDVHDLDHLDVIASDVAPQLR
jgi:alkanesulfonate monooxygenase SsuD/methylene tetrahydromethanopterin reductase-like flavin-dependent oxidoreductase (luciferase family)